MSRWLHIPLPRKWSVASFCQFKWTINRIKVSTSNDIITFIQTLPAFCFEKQTKDTNENDLFRWRLFHTSNNSFYPGLIYRSQHYLAPSALFTPTWIYLPPRYYPIRLLYSDICREHFEIYSLHLSAAVMCLFWILLKQRSAKKENIKIIIILNTTLSHDNDFRKQDIGPFRA